MLLSAGIIIELDSSAPVVIFVTYCLLERTEGPGLREFRLVYISVIEVPWPSNAPISSTALPSFGASVFADSNSVSFSLSIFGIWLSLLS